MPWGAVAAAVIGGVMSNQAAKKGAKASEKGGAASIAEQRRQYDLSRADQAPWMQHGQKALGGLDALNSGDYSGFMNSPDYLYARDSGMEGINRHLASKGGYYSGGGDADRMKFMSGLATQNLGNYRGALQSSAGMGQSTASGLGQLGANMANNIGQTQIGIGNARASSYQQQGDNYAGMAAAAGNAFGNWYQNRNASQGRR